MNTDPELEMNYEPSWIALALSFVCFASAWLLSTVGHEAERVVRNWRMR